MNQLWRRKAGSVHASLIAGTFVPIVWGLIMVILTSMVAAEVKHADLYGLEHSLNGIYSKLSLFSLFGLLLMLGIYIWLCVALSGFASIQKTHEDKQSVKKVLGGYLVLVLGSFAGVIISAVITVVAPSLGTLVSLLLTTIIPVVAYNMMVNGYGALSVSKSFSPRCHEGFEKLSQSSTLSLVTLLINFILSILMMIPALASKDIMEIITLLASLAVLVLWIVSIVKLLSGWGIVKNNAPVEEESL